MPALIVQENVAENEFGGVEVWSTDSEDEAVRRPTYGKAFVAKEESSWFEGRFLMVTSDGSQNQKHTIGSRRRDNSCFATRPVTEQIKDCEQLINKVNFILESLNIPMSRYETKLNDLKFTFSNISDSLERTRLTNSNLTDQISREQHPKNTGQKFHF